MTAERPSGQALSTSCDDGAARAVALEQMRKVPATPTSLVGYRSAGRVLIAGHESMAREAAMRLQGAGLTLSLLVTDTGPAPDAARDEGVQVIRAPLAAVRGHLGAFQVDVQSGEGVRALAPSILTGHQLFDVVLDLGARPAIAAPVPPPGYFAPGRDPDRLEEAIAAIPNLVGEFEKPRYFSYDPVRPAAPAV